jgi:hypothetical protein
MTLLAFVAALLGSLIAFRNPLAGAIIAAALFAAASSPGIGLPIVKTIEMDGVTG